MRIQLHGRFGIEITYGQLDLVPGEPVHIDLDSPGGSTETAVAIFHAIRTHDGPTSLRIVRAGSAAFLIALAADDRVIARDGWMMTHGARGCSVGTASDHGRYLDMLTAADRRLNTLIGERTGLTDEQITGLAEQWLDAPRCLELGLAHRIGAPANIGWRAPAYDAAARAREIVALIDREHAALADSEKAESIAVERVAAAADVQFRDAIPNPSPLGITDDTSLDELRRIVAGQNEVRRRRLEILDHAALQARATTAAINAGIALPAATPPAWHCPCCGEPNYHTPGTGPDPAPCLTCRGTTPANGDYGND